MSGTLESLVKNLETSIVQIKQKKALSLTQQMAFLKIYCHFDSRKHSKAKDEPIM